MDMVGKGLLINQGIEVGQYGQRIFRNRGRQ
jgi:hypothetical protein